MAINQSIMPHKISNLLSHHIFRLFHLYFFSQKNIPRKIANAFPALHWAPASEPKCRGGVGDSEASGRHQGDASQTAQDPDLFFKILKATHQRFEFLKKLEECGLFVTSQVQNIAISSIFFLIWFCIYFFYKFGQKIYLACLHRQPDQVTNLCTSLISRRWFSPKFQIHISTALPIRSAQPTRRLTKLTP